MSDTDHVAAISDAAQIVDECLQTTTDTTEASGIAALNSIADHVNELQRELSLARNKIELLEWMAYQRRQRPEWSNEEILGRIPYLPEWRELEGVTVQS